ncbi:MAG: tetratricopeptide repeat protein [Elusimicrobia bacterium]|nr:tetratricopeptide repeat protein [Elusimicrobiota bacterium]
MILHSFTLVCLLALPAALQAQDIDKDIQKPAREETEQQRSSRLAAEAAKREAPGEDVAYEAVLADPDNVQLNYRYARAQVRRGDVKGAAATLERILLVDPKQTEIRLFYAIVLYRLDNMIEARRELDALKKLSLPPPLAEEAAKYAKAVESRSKRTHLNATAGLGFEYDTNRNAAPNRALFGGTDITPAQRRDDTSLIFLGSIGAKRDLPFQAVPEVFGSFTYYQAEQTLSKTLNLKAYSVAGGTVYRRGRAKLTPTALFDHVQLAQSTFLKNRGGELRLDYRFSPAASLFCSVKDVYQDFMATREVASAPERNGVQVDVALGGERILGPTMKAGIMLGRGFKNAAQAYWGYDRTTLGLNHSWLLGRGMFLLSSFNVNEDHYKQADTAIGGGYRKDTTMRAAGTLGAPLGLLHPKLKDLLWTLTYEYYHALSNVPNYAYTNNKLATMITYRWEVGL